MHYESFKRILDTKKNDNCFNFDEERTNCFNFDEERTTVYIKKLECNSTQVHGDTIYLGIENINISKPNDHPSSRFCPDIFFFVHDDEYILTLKRLYLAFCFPSNQVKERVIMLPFPTYNRINRKRIILPNNKDFLVNIGTYTGKTKGIRRKLRVRDKRPYMCFKISDITKDPDKFKASIRNVIKDHIHDEYVKAFERNIKGEIILRILVFLHFNQFS